MQAGGFLPNLAIWFATQAGGIPSAGIPRIAVHKQFFVMDQFDETMGDQVKPVLILRNNNTMLKNTPTNNRDGKIQPN